MIDVKLEKEKLRQEFEVMYSELAQEPEEEESFDDKMKRLMNRKKLLGVINSLSDFDKEADGNGDDGMGDDSEPAKVSGISDFRAKHSAGTGTIKKMDDYVHQ